MYVAVGFNPLAQKPMNLESSKMTKGIEKP
jgi:hypothetical protein